MTAYEASPPFLSPTPRHTYQRNSCVRHLFNVVCQKKCHSKSVRFHVCKHTSTLLNITTAVKNCISLYVLLPEVKPLQSIMAVGRVGAFKASAGHFWHSLHLKKACLTVLKSSKQLMWILWCAAVQGYLWNISYFVPFFCCFSCFLWKSKA